MLTIQSTELIVPFSSLSPEEQINISLYYDTHDENTVLEIEPGVYRTKTQLEKGNPPADIRIPYSEDMFFNAYPVISKNGVAISCENGENKGVIVYNPTTYTHEYIYKGGVDTDFIDMYDCIFLYNCNEYSVEICRCLNFWRGNRLILVGESWEPMIPYLPDLPDKYCIYKDVLTQEDLMEFSKGVKCLYISHGIPHSEPMDRFYAGIMYYDEIMSFLFLFANLKSYGDKYKDKKFFVVNPYYGNLGLFVCFAKAVSVAKYAKSKGFIPVININRGVGGIYQDYPEDEIWNKFFNQPEGYTMEDIKEASNVFISPGFYNGLVQTTLMEKMSGNVSLEWIKGVYNDAVVSYVEERMRRFLPNPEKTLGVLMRGTDYVNSSLANHPIHANPQQMFSQIDEIWDEWGGFDFIYLATEDEDYCEIFEEHYGDILKFTDQKRYTTGKGELLYQLHKEAEDKLDGFTLGAQYIASIYLLSKCKSLIASGGCAGVSEAIKQNEGKYEHTFVFDLGKN